jgi:hypothetical protein
MRYVGLALVGFLVGCGPVEEPVYPASGRVLFRDRRPVSAGVIEFVPSNGVSARAKLNPDGTFTLATGKRPGAVAGRHRVMIVQMVIADGAAEHAGKHLGTVVIHPKYAKLTTSELEFDVTATGPNEFTIEVDTATEKRGW